MRRIVYAMILVLLLSSSAAAQENSSKLLEMLARIPANPDTMRYATFLDRVAIERAYPGSTKPDDIATFETSWDANNAADPGGDVALWWLIYRNALDPTGMYAFSALDEIPEVMGFDFFAIQQVMEAGGPPSNILLLNGAFDAAAIESAFIAQGFVAQENGEARLVCHPEGCGEGMMVDVRERNQANLFGGNLGRKQPLWIGDGFLLSSPDFAVVRGAINNTISLADQPTLRAIVTSLEARGTVIQAAVYSPADLMGGDPARAGDDAALEPLPAYLTMMLADVMTEEEQQGIAAFSYADRASAETAAVEMLRRVETLNSLVMPERTYLDLVTDRKASASTEIIEVDGWFVLLLTLASPRLAPDEIFIAMDMSASIAEHEALPGAAPGILYRLLNDMVMRRDTEWLRPTP